MRVAYQFQGFLYFNPLSTKSQPLKYLSSFHFRLIDVVCTAAWIRLMPSSIVGANTKDTIGLPLVSFTLSIILHPSSIDTNEIVVSTHPVWYAITSLSSAISLKLFMIFPLKSIVFNFFNKTHIPSNVSYLHLLYDVFGKLVQFPRFRNLGTSGIPAWILI